MGNMCYCRFQNTLRDLKDCHEHIEILSLSECVCEEDQFCNCDEQPLSHEEAGARKDLIGLCVKIALDYGHEINEPVMEDK